MEHTIYIEFMKIQNQLVDLSEKYQYLYEALIKGGVIKEDEKKKEVNK